MPLQYGGSAFDAELPKPPAPKPYDPKADPYYTAIINGIGFGTGSAPATPKSPTYTWGDIIPGATGSVSGPAASLAPPAPPAPTKPQAAPSFDAFPSVIAAKNAENLGLAETEGWMKQAREQAIIRFGDTALASMAGFGLDPQAGTFTRQNYLSGNADLARLDKSHKDRRQAIINRLAGRGLLRSGDLGYLEGEENQLYGNQTYDARQQVLRYLSEIAAEHMRRKQGLRGSVLNAYQDAYQGFLGNPDAYLGAF